MVLFMIAALVVSLSEYRKWYKDKSYREIAISSALLTIGFVFCICWIIKVNVPSPMDIVLAPIQPLCNKLVQLLSTSDGGY